MITNILVGVFGGSAIITALFVSVAYYRHRHELADSSSVKKDPRSDLSILKTACIDVWMNTQAYRVLRRTLRIARLLFTRLLRALMRRGIQYVKPLFRSAKNQFRPAYRTSAHNGRSASIYLKDISEHKRKMSNGVNTAEKSDTSEDKTQ